MQNEDKMNSVLLPIEMYKIAGMKCFDMAQAMASLYYNRNYELMFLDCWNFEYNESQPLQEDIIGKYISQGKCNINENLLKFHGIETIEVKSIEKKQIFNYIMDKLHSNMPVFLWYDQYYMPWTKEIRRQELLRYNGYIMIIGYDISQQFFYCIDIHGTQKREILPWKDFMDFVYTQQSINCYIYMKRPINCEINVEYYLSHLKEQVEDTKKDYFNLFQQMHNAAAEIKQQFNFEQEIKYTIEFINKQLTAPTQVPMVTALIDVARMRSLYALSLTYIGKKVNDTEFIDFANQFRLLYAEWQMLVSILIKAFYKKDFKDLQNKIADGIVKIAREEEKVYYKMVHKDKDIKLPLKKENSNKSNINKTYVYCDLKEYINNCGFKTKYLERQQADFDGLGNYFICCENLKEISLKNIRYKLNIDIYDNIKCKAQTILVEKALYKEIGILGACDSGGFFGKLEIFYDDKHKEEQIFGLGEWRFEKCEFGEQVIWVGDRYYFGNVNDEEKGYLFSYIIKLHSNRQIEQIKLPDCPNMHIFGITLIR